MPFQQLLEGVAASPPHQHFVKRLLGPQQLQDIRCPTATRLKFLTVDFQRANLWSSRHARRTGSRRCTRGPPAPRRDRSPPRATGRSLAPFCATTVSSPSAASSRIASRNVVRDTPSRSMNSRSMRRCPGFSWKFRIDWRRASIVCWRTEVSKVRRARSSKWGAGHRPRDHPVAHGHRRCLEPPSPPRASERSRCGRRSAPVPRRPGATAPGRWRPGPLGLLPARPVATAMLMSFTISRRPNPELKVPGRMKFGHLFSVDPLRPLELLKIDSMTSGSIPKPLPGEHGLAGAQRWVADSRLLSALTAWPEPIGPAWTTLPISRAGTRPSTSRPPHHRP